MNTSNTPSLALTMSGEDMVANVLIDVIAGQKIDVVGHQSVKKIVAKDNIPAFHKIALQPISESQSVCRGGCQIGRATEEIQIGSWVHIHNLTSLRAKKMKG